jgi:hypothetical protein
MIFRVANFSCDSSCQSIFQKKFVSARRRILQREISLTRLCFPLTLKVLTAESLVLTAARRPIGIAAVIASPGIALLRAQDGLNMHHSKLLDRKLEHSSSFRKIPEL